MADPMDVVELASFESFPASDPPSWWAVTPKAMSQWIYFIHPPREDFADTMTEHEQSVFAEHFAHLKRLLADGVLVLAGPTLGRHNTGIAIFVAEDETHARRVMESDPVIRNGIARGELRPFRVSLIRGAEA